MRLLLLVGLLAQVGWGCMCLLSNVESPCDGLQKADIVFVAWVVKDSSLKLGTGPARVIVEKAIRGVPKGVREIEVDSDSETSCHFRLRLGERYVIFGQRKKGREDFVVETNSCTHSFGVRGNELKLSALLAGARGQGGTLVGRVDFMGQISKLPARRSSIGVFAVMKDQKIESRTNKDGEFLFFNLKPGQYELEVERLDTWGKDIEVYHFPNGPVAVTKTNCAASDMAISLQD